jgi:hypothetical protein
LASWTAKLPTPPVAKALESGDRRHRHGGRFLERQARRLQRHGVQGHRDILGEAAVAVVQEVGVDLVARLEPGDAAADRRHLPGDVDTEDPVLGPQQAQGGPGEQGLAAQHVPVGGVDRCCQHLDQDLVGVRGGLVDLRHPECLRRPVLLVDERPHDWSFPTRGRGDAG